MEATFAGFDRGELRGEQINTGHLEVLFHLFTHTHTHAHTHTHTRTHEHTRTQLPRHYHFHALCQSFAVENLFSICVKRSRNMYSLLDSRKGMGRAFIESLASLLTSPSSTGKSSPADSEHGVEKGGGFVADADASADAGTEHVRKTVTV